MQEPFFPFSVGAYGEPSGLSSGLFSGSAAERPYSWPLTSTSPQDRRWAHADFS